MAGLQEFVAKGFFNADAKPRIFPRHGRECSQWIHNREGLFLPDLASKTSVPVSNRRTVGLSGRGWVPRGRHAPSVVSMGETSVQGPRAAYALVSMKSSWVNGSRNAPLPRRRRLGSKGAGTPLVDGVWGERSFPIGAVEAQCPMPHHSQRDATGERSDLPCQDARVVTRTSCGQRKRRYSLLPLPYARRPVSRSRAARKHSICHR